MTLSLKEFEPLGFTRNGKPVVTLSLAKMTKHYPVASVMWDLIDVGDCTKIAFQSILTNFTFPGTLVADVFDDHKWLKHFTWHSRVGVWVRYSKRFRRQLAFERGHHESGTWDVRT